MCRSGKSVSVTSCLLLVLHLGVLLGMGVITGGEARPSHSETEDLKRNSNVNNVDFEEEQAEFHLEIKRRFLANLGFDDIPQYSVQERNISKEEYLRAYTEYMLNVRDRRRRERGEDVSDHPKTRRKQAEIFVETIQSSVQFYTESPDSAIEGGTLRFSLDLEKYYEDNYRLQVRDALLVLPKDCFVVNEANRIDFGKNAAENVVDLTRNLSRFVSRSMSEGGVVTFEVAVNCWMDEDKDSAENEDNVVEGNVEASLKIVWMKMRTSGGVYSNNINVGGRSRRSVTSAGFGLPERRHNRILKHQHLYHRLADFVDSDQGMGSGDNGGSGNGASSNSRLSVVKRFRKKHGRDCGQTKHGKTCCRKPLEVSFEDLRITDVILAPSRFNMDYCEGRCSTNARRLPYASNHAMFQHILNRSRDKEVTPKLCCAPTKFSEIDVIQMDPKSPNALKVTVIHNARVEECGCS